MSRNLLIALFAAASAQAQTPTFSLSLTSENGGADTRFTLSYTGTPTWADDQSNTGSLGLAGLEFYSLSHSNYPSLTVTGSSGSFLSSSISGNLPNITGLDTGLYWTNTPTGQTSTLSFIGFSRQVGLINLRFDQMYDTSPGEQIVLSGPTSVSFLSGLAFSNFNAGSWTGQNHAMGSWRPNYDIILNVGAPIPEPSTYGLILGGLALAGAAIRRRKSAK